MTERRRWHTHPPPAPPPPKEPASLVVDDPLEPLYLTLKAKKDARLRAHFDMFVKTLKQNHWLSDLTISERSEIVSDYKEQIKKAPISPEKLRQPDVYKYWARLLTWPEIVQTLERIRLRGGTSNEELFKDAPPPPKKLMEGPPYYATNGGPVQFRRELIPHKVDNMKTRALYPDDPFRGRGLDPLNNWGVIYEYGPRSGDTPIRVKMACCQQNIPNKGYAEYIYDEKKKTGFYNGYDKDVDQLVDGCWIQMDPNEEVGKVVPYRVFQFKNNKKPTSVVAGIIRNEQKKGTISPALGNQPDRRDWVFAFNLAGEIFMAKIEKSTKTGTAFVDANFYIELDQRIRKLAFSVATAYIELYKLLFIATTVERRHSITESGVKSILAFWKQNNPTMTVEFLDACKEMYTLVHRYNEPQNGDCGAPALPVTDKEWEIYLATEFFKEPYEIEYIDVTTTEEKEDDDEKLERKRKEEERQQKAAEEKKEKEEAARRKREKEEEERQQKAAEVARRKREEEKEEAARRKREKEEKERQQKAAEAARRKREEEKEKEEAAKRKQQTAGISALENDRQKFEAEVETLLNVWTTLKDLTGLQLTDSKIREIENKGLAELVKFKDEVIVVSSLPARLKTARLVLEATKNNIVTLILDPLKTRTNEKLTAIVSASKEDASVKQQAEKLKLRMWRLIAGLTANPQKEDARNLRDLLTEITKFEEETAAKLEKKKTSAPPPKEKEEAEELSPEPSQDQILLIINDTKKDWYAAEIDERERANLILGKNKDTLEKIEDAVRNNRLTVVEVTSKLEEVRKALDKAKELMPKIRELTSGIVAALATSALLKPETMEEQKFINVQKELRSLLEESRTVINADRIDILVKTMKIANQDLNKAIRKQIDADLQTTRNIFNNTKWNDLEALLADEALSDELKTAVKNFRIGTLAEFGRYSNFQNDTLILTDADLQNPEIFSKIMRDIKEYSDNFGQYINDIAAFMEKAKAERKAAETRAARETEEAKRREAEKEEALRERLAREEAEKVAAEKAERAAARKAEEEKERAAREETERAAAEKAKKEEAERAAARKAEEERERVAREAEEAAAAKERERAAAANNPGNKVFWETDNEPIGELKNVLTPYLESLNNAITKPENANVLLLFPNLYMFCKKFQALHGESLAKVWSKWGLPDLKEATVQFLDAIRNKTFTQVETFMSSPKNSDPINSVLAKLEDTCLIFSNLKHISAASPFTALSTKESADYVTKIFAARFTEIRLSSKEFKDWLALFMDYFIFEIAKKSRDEAWGAKYQNIVRYAGTLHEPVTRKGIINDNPVPFLLRLKSFEKGPWEKFNNEITFIVEPVKEPANEDDDDFSVLAEFINEVDERAAKEIAKEAGYRIN